MFWQAASRTIDSRKPKSYTEARRPNSRLTTNNTRNTKNKIFAIPAALAAMPPKPNTAATNATIKNKTAQLNMICFLLYGGEKAATDHSETSAAVTLGVPQPACQKSVAASFVLNKETIPLKGVNDCPFEQDRTTIRHGINTRLRCGPEFDWFALIQDDRFVTKETRQKSLVVFHHAKFGIT